MAEPDKKPRTTRNILGLVLTVMVGVYLTVLAIPILLLATCFPLMQGNSTPTRWGFAGLASVAFGVGLMIAVRTTNAGVRWGMAVLLVLFLCVGLYFLL